MQKKITIPRKPDISNTGIDEFILGAKAETLRSSIQPPSPMPEKPVEAFESLSGGSDGIKTFPLRLPGHIHRAAKLRARQIDVDMSLHSYILNLIIEDTLKLR